MKKHISTKDITNIAIMATLVFIATFLIKIPSLNGYTHIGDSMVIISALILGKKKGALAAGLGAALCDLLSGYMQYIIPTFLIKAIMVLIIATIAENLINKTKFAWILGAIIGCTFQVVGYCLVETILYGFAGALASVPANIIQSIVGIALAVVLSTVLEKSNILNKLKTN
ncbi:ECF transporter S component [uncultured Clostridium sp.]|uniref:ECF transporter S component n=1 Tax=uncultured Clostridium sp. TaxID=59620 RepID=UPI0025DAA88A|nr:ECF transporter S component [uncultured Clostridium sp.]MDU4881975.1 ECF transporter S component [Clostridium celatum]MDU7075429.1 ECF transporter S component [Clostridium celatum]